MKRTHKVVSGNCNHICHDRKGQDHTSIHWQARPHQFLRSRSPCPAAPPRPPHPCQTPRPALWRRASHQRCYVSSRSMRFNAHSRNTQSRLSSRRTCLGVHAKRYHKQVALHPGLLCVQLLGVEAQRPLACYCREMEHTEMDWATFACKLHERQASLHVDGQEACDTTDDPAPEGSERARQLRRCVSSARLERP